MPEPEALLKGFVARYMQGALLAELPALQNVWQSHPKCGAALPPPTNFSIRYVAID
jgi:hypothetical protein